MKQRHLVTALALGLSVAVLAGSSLADGTASDRVLVKFKPGSGAQIENSLRGAGGRVHHRFDNINAMAVSLPRKMVDALRNNPNVEYVEEDAKRYPMAQSIPYGIDQVQARDIWDANRDGVIDSGAADGTGIKVCIIDSGIHSSHEDFAGVNISGGFPSDYGTDTCGHGSHVAGTIAAANNAAGVIGVSPGKVSLHILKVFNGASCGWSYSSTLIDAANRCAAAGAKVISMSLGGSTSSTTENTGFQNLYSQGVLSIAAAGNAGNTTKSYPASYASVMSVAAVDSSKALATFSQRNDAVEISAPGVGVLSTVPFVTASASVAGQSYMVEAFELTFQGSATGGLVSGGRCTATNSAWAGKVVLCERGDIAFADKTNNVANSGGSAVIIYNNVAGGFGGTLGTAGPAVPAVSMSQADGQFLSANRIGSSATVNTIANNQGNGYANYDGTSMATPHVSGVAAVVWSANPNWTNVQVREALVVTAEDLGTVGRDDSFGWGLVRAKAALDYLNGGGGGPGPAVTAKVSTISMTKTKRGQKFTTTATPTIVNQGGQALASASVTGCFSGAVSGCSTKITGSNGQAGFTSAQHVAGTVTFCVTNVTGTNITFDATNACKSL